MKRQLGFLFIVFCCLASSAFAEFTLLVDPDTEMFSLRGSVTTPSLTVDGSGGGAIVAQTAGVEGTLYGFTAPFVSVFADNPSIQTSVIIDPYMYFADDGGFIIDLIEFSNLSSESVSTTITIAGSDAWYSYADLPSEYKQALAARTGTFALVGWDYNAQPIPDLPEVAGIVQAVPEPSASLLTLGALLAIGFRRAPRRRGR